MNRFASPGIYHCRVNGHPGHRRHFISRCCALIYPFCTEAWISQKTVQVRNALELARGLALSQRQVWTVCTVDAANSCVSSAGLRLLVFRDDNDDKDFNTGEMLHQDIDINSIELEMSASFGRPYIRFARNGEALGIRQY